MKVNPVIFKAYDIRGIYPAEINEETAYLIGKAFVDFFDCKCVVVGKDMRASSPSLYQALTKGITEQGADVINIGMVATPMLNYAVMKLEQSYGIMISASHNPGKYNAFKLVKNAGSGVLQIHDGTGIREIFEIVQKGEFKKAEKSGSIIEKNISAEYDSQVMKATEGIKDIKIIVDYGNGVGSLSSKKVLHSLPIEIVEYFEEPDGNFPNHEPNPHEIENLAFLQKKVIEEKGDLGIFFDGDADRSVFIDEKGEIIFSDIAIGVLAEEALKKNPGGKIFYDLRATKAIEEAVTKNGGQAITLRVGNPFCKEALVEQDGILAGELSGHIMFKEHYGIDDGLYAAIKFMSAMCNNNKKASELTKPFKKYFQTEEINMRVTDADDILEQVKNNYLDGELITIDGLLIKYKSWWLSLRKSNTEPLVRLRIEAETKELLEEKRAELLKIILP